MFIGRSSIQSILRNFLSINNPAEARLRLAHVIEIAQSQLDRRHSLLPHPEQPLARPGIIRDAPLRVPRVWLQIATWTSLAAELIFLPMSLGLTTRKVAWLAMSGLQIAILCVVNFADLTLAMLLAHLFTFDPRWLPLSAAHDSLQAQVRPRIPRELESA